MNPENTDSPSSLSQAIENLSRKRHVLSDEAIKAGQDRHILETSPQFKRKASVIEEFNHSVQLLVSVFKESNFDELAMFVAHPSRVLIVNFFIGVMRGLGFLTGILLLIMFLAYVFQHQLPSQIIPLLLR